MVLPTVKYILRSSLSSRTWRLLYTLCIAILSFVFLFRSSATTKLSWKEGSILAVPNETSVDDVGGIVTPTDVLRYFSPESRGIGKDAGPKLGGRVIITGGGGNIGKYLIRKLLASGTPITVIDTIFFEEELEDIRQDFPAADSLLQVRIGDIRNSELLASLFTPDVVGVVHLAAVSRVLWCLENEADCKDVNVRGTGLVMDALNRAHFETDPWFILASSREVYGKVEKVPVEESAPRIALNVYGATKAQAEMVVEEHVERRNEYVMDKPIHCMALRLSNAYGGIHDHRERLIPSIMTQALSHRPIQIVGGNQNLDMIHIDDVGQAFILAMNRLEQKRLKPRVGWNGKSKSSFEIFNIAAGQSILSLDLVGKIISITRSSSPMTVIPEDARFPDFYVGSTVKAAKLLGFKPKVDIDEGLHRLASAYLRETIDYLEDKVQTTCQQKPKPTMDDIEWLAGCESVILAANIDGNLAHLYIEHDHPNPIDRYLFGSTSTPDFLQLQMNKTSDGKRTFAFHSWFEHSKGALKNVLPVRDGTVTSGSFHIDLNPTTGYFTLSLADTGAKLRVTGEGGKLIVHTGEEDPTEFQMTPLECTKKDAPWPFLKDDPLTSAILDYVSETPYPFDGSQDKVLCGKLSDALSVARLKLQAIQKMHLPIQIPPATLPMGSSSEWRLRGLPTCPNLCDHPTVCVDTGMCMCTQAFCKPKNRFPFLRNAHGNDISYPPSSFNRPFHPDALIDQVAKSTWLNVLHGPASRYLTRHPALPRVNVTALPDEAQKHRDENSYYDDLLPGRPGCFTADSAMERGLKLISEEVEDDSLVFLPYYEGTAWYPNLWQWHANAIGNNLPEHFDERNLIIPFAHDWGICNQFVRNVFDARLQEFHPHPVVTQGIAWSVMGDLNSDCYRPFQDVVMPSRTCLQDKLRTAFSDIRNVKPIRRRRYLAFFKGSYDGTGTTVRRKIMNDRPYHKVKSPRLRGGNYMPTLWNKFGEDQDYLQTLNDTVFCPLPRGTTGWATRTIDVIYAGCIPVLIGDQTHHPFWDILDWTKFAVLIQDHELDRMEEILIGYTWQELQTMQTNLMLIRDAFLYPADDNMELHLEQRGPMFFALHQSALLSMTRYPSRRERHY